MKSRRIDYAKLARRVAEVIVDERRRADVVLAPSLNDDALIVQVTLSGLELHESGALWR